MRPLLLLPLLVACTAYPDVEPVFEPGSSDFFGTPFPSAARSNPSGGPDWTGFPDPRDNDVLQRYLLRAENIEGAGHNSPFWLRFDDDLVLDLLPTPAGSQAEDASLQLIDLTEGPGFGARTPIVWNWWPTAGAYVENRMLSVAPVPGWPLDADHTYALVVTTEIAAPPSAFSDVFGSDEGGWGTALQPLWKAAPDVGLKRKEIAMASVIHTARPIDEMETVARFVAEDLPAAEIVPQLARVQGYGSYTVYETTYRSPLMMSGTKPYASEGGAFTYDGGVPVVTEWEDMRLSVAFDDRFSTPEDGWPVVVFVDGTGGDYLTYASSDSPYEIGAWASELGALALSIDLPLHGTRGTSGTAIELHSFNVLQPESALYMHRQGALDLIYLIASLAEGGVSLTDPDGRSLPIDPSRIVVAGHSQGGIATALALPWLGGRVQGAAMSGTGGLLSITAVERQADIDFVSLIRQGLGLDGDETLNEHHPFIGLVQTLVDPTDPINYAPYWFHTDAGLAGQGPVPVLLTSGKQDDQTPPRTAEALAAAGRVPFAGRQRSEAPGMGLRGFDTTTLPTEANAQAFDGTVLTAGLAQYKDGNHWVIWSDPKARDLFRNFVATALDGDAVLTLEAE